MKKSKRENADKRLNPRQEKFCKLYASDIEFFGNGVASYISAYNINPSAPGAYASARASSSQLLTNNNICARINEILEQDGLNNEFVDKQLRFLITQHTNFDTKIRAISEYNKLKRRISEHQVDLNLTVETVSYKANQKKASKSKKVKK